MNQTTAGCSNLSTRAASRALSVSKTSVETAKRIMAKGPAPLLDAIRDGTVTIHRADQLAELDDRAVTAVLKRGRKGVLEEAKQIRDEVRASARAEKLARHAEIAAKGVGDDSLEALRASGPFSVVLADPPWQQDVWSEKTGADRNADNHYPVLDLEEIMAHAPPVTDEALLFLWCTANNLVVRGLPVLEAWGFTYVTQMIWDKEHIGTGRWVRDRHEILLIGKRGAFPAPLPGLLPASVHREAKTAHSAKPSRFRDHITAMTEGLAAENRLEMYGPSNDPRFTPWGWSHRPEQEAG